MKRKRKQTESLEAVHTHTHTYTFKESGITLIALVITIVILLILAGISLNLVLGDNGIVTKANLAVVKQENATVAEGLQFKVTYYNMDSIEDIKTALQAEKIINADGQVDTYTLLEQKLKTGNGSNNKDVYVIEDEKLYYYNKNNEKIDLGNLWSLQTADLEETDSSLFEVDNIGNLMLKDYQDYYNHDHSQSPKTWKLENLVIPKTVDGKEVKILSFTTGATPVGWENIKTIVIPETVINIKTYAFAGCSNLSRIIVNENNTVYDSRDNCNAIIETETNKLITGCKNTVIPSDVEAIGDWAFSGRTGLKNLIISKNIKDIGSATFSGCSGLESIIVDENNAIYDSRNGCNAIIEKETNGLVLGCKNTIIPNNIVEIFEYAFYGCTGLANILIPASVTSIGRYAFGRMYRFNKHIDTRECNKYREWRFIRMYRTYKYINTRECNKYRSICVLQLDI